MSIDLNKLENKLDEALSNETSETLNKFLTDKTMSNNKQSSIEWLEQELKKIPFVNVLEVFEQAEAMRKDEIKNAQMDMFIHLNNLPYGLEYLEKRQSAEDFSQQYYNETFGGNNEQQ